MKIIPEPKSLELKAGYFVVGPDTELFLNFNLNSALIKAVTEFQTQILDDLGFKPALNKSLEIKEDNNIYLTIEQEFNQSGVESYFLEVNAKNIIINANSEQGLFYGIQSLSQIIKNEGRKIPLIKIKDSPYFKTRGFYHDLSRGKVPKLETLKKLVDKLAAYKINQLQLYFEHSFLFKDLSEVWTGADPLTAAEIISLDHYCQERYVELVPSLASFGHLYTALSSNTFSHLAELRNSNQGKFSWIERMRHYTLDVSNPESLKFIQKILSEFVPLFSSDKFNICGDETFDLGMDKNRQLLKEKGKGRLYIDFLNKIISELKKYNKEVMIWGDIILKYSQLIPELADDLIILNWDYSKKPEVDNVKIIKNNNYRQYLCPGLLGWNRLINNFGDSFANIRKMTEYGVKYEAEGILNTNWGDYGNLNFLNSSLIGMIYGAELSWNPKLSDQEIEAKISFLEFGAEKTELISLLKKLSKQHLIGWDLIVAWKEKLCQQSSYYDEMDFQQKFEKVGTAELKKAYQEAKKIAAQILDTHNLVKPRKVSILAEFNLLARGVALFNSLALVIKKYYLKEKEVELIEQPTKLAELFEYWLKDYMVIWRKYNKESELYRIRESIVDINDYLRKII